MNPSNLSGEFHPVLRVLNHDKPQILTSLPLLQAKHNVQDQISKAVIVANKPVYVPKPLKRQVITDENGNSIIVPLLPKKLCNQAPIVSNSEKGLASITQISTGNPAAVGVVELNAVPAVPSVYKTTSLAKRKLSLSLKKPQTKQLVSLQSNDSPVPLEGAVQDKTTSSAVCEISNEHSVPCLLTPEAEQIIEPTDTLKESLERTLPSNYSHKTVSVEPLKPYHKHDNFDQREMFAAQIRLNLQSKEDALLWLDDYKKSSNTDWRVRRTYPENTQQIIFKKGFRCAHNTLAQYRDTKAAHNKQTQCDAFISISVKNFKMKRSSDTLLKSHPCEIIINHCHNHPIQAADSLKHRRPGPAIVEIFTDLFRKGHSPSSALHTHQYDLQIAHAEHFFEILADGAECPNLQWTYHLYRKLYQKECGAPSGIAMVEALKAAVEKYNAVCGTDCAIVEIFEDSDIVLALCTPFMKRVHQYLKASGEMGFIDWR